MADTDKILAEIARKACERISRKVILAIQKMTEGRLSGDDSGLKNLWDEVCCQVAMSSRKGARAGGEKGATWVQE